MIGPKIALHYLTRPKRQIYKEEKMPIYYLLKSSDVPIMRHPIRYQNVRGERLAGSLYLAPDPTESEACIIYLHGNASSQLEGRFLVPLLIPLGISVFLFDFAGCGLSEGDIVTMGKNESDDVVEIIDFLETNYSIHKIFLWGRSMGAATAIFTIAKRQDIAGIVVDSPYAKIINAVLSIAKEHHASIFLTKDFEDRLKVHSINKLGFDITKMNPLSVMNECYTPAFFIHAKNDTTIPIDDSRILFDKYPSHVKQFAEIKGDHYSERPSYIIKEGIIFLCRLIGLTIRFPS